MGNKPTIQDAFTYQAKFKYRKAKWEESRKLIIHSIREEHNDGEKIHKKNKKITEFIMKTIKRNKRKKQSQVWLQAYDSVKTMIKDVKERIWKEKDYVQRRGEKQTHLYRNLQSDELVTKTFAELKFKQPRNCKV
ncbi:hypothetical protein HELRODRAFT_169231 [Helobdella robusta]|uniref:Uncharacterized protein n=1 Tax=Helobdella robusta TaxID=6412 RepID=T1F1L7_HELRO|nr:hypothetical protein HELRODRAFT_169231 [Helobdella robusta]ESO08399.1 hypothetical protein HELRODRAFT_169231 [Helobdella robusta]